MKEQVIEKVKELAACDNTFATLKECAEGYIASIGTENESESAAKFVDRLQQDVMPIDKTIKFLKSEHGKNIFGDKVDEMLAAFEKAQSEGEDTCICPACQLGKQILAEKAELL